MRTVGTEVQHVLQLRRAAGCIGHVQGVALGRELQAQGLGVGGLPGQHQRMLAQPRRLELGQVRVVGQQRVGAHPDFPGGRMAPDDRQGGCGVVVAAGGVAGDAADARDFGAHGQLALALLAALFP